MNTTRTLRNAAIALIAGTVLSTTTAFAGTVIDKGDLGKYERQGRFVHRIATPAARPSNGTAVKDAGQVTYDKGELGTYERSGRFVWRAPRVNANTAENVASGPGFSEREYRVVNHHKHTHKY
jgi:hypothetical protein